MSRRNHQPGFLHRTIAAICATMVFGLSLLAASPAAHNWLHSSQSSHSCPDHPKSTPATDTGDHGCAVVLFASGVDTPVAAFTLVPPRFVTRNVSPATAAELYLVTPRYLRRPERGPPSNRVV